MGPQETITTAVLNITARQEKQPRVEDIITDILDIITARREKQPRVEDISTI